MDGFVSLRKQNEDGTVSEQTVSAYAWKLRSKDGFKDSVGWHVNQTISSPAPAAPVTSATPAFIPPIYKDMRAEQRSQEVEAITGNPVEMTKEEMITATEKKVGLPVSKQKKSKGGK
jgi:hypothetical protein